jgi:hypothetical protein
MATRASLSTVIALLKKAADMAKEDCARVMDVAHKLSFSNPCC